MYHYHQHQHQHLLFTARSISFDCRLCSAVDIYHLILRFSSHCADFSLYPVSWFNYFYLFFSFFVLFGFGDLASFNGLVRSISLSLSTRGGGGGGGLAGWLADHLASADFPFSWSHQQKTLKPARVRSQTHAARCQVGPVSLVSSRHLFRSRLKKHKPTTERR